MDLFLNKYFPPVERSETSAMCVTLQQVHLNLYHPCIADHHPPSPPNSPFSDTRHLPHSLLAMILSPLLRLPPHHLKERFRKLCSRRRSVVVAAVAHGRPSTGISWWSGGAGGKEQPDPAFQWENSCSPSLHTIISIKTRILNTKFKMLISNFKIQNSCLPSIDQIISINI